MADVATTCISGNPVINGSALTRMPNTANFTVRPKIDNGLDNGELEAIYDNRFDDVGYYYT